MTISWMRTSAQLLDQSVEEKFVIVLERSKLMQAPSSIQYLLSPSQICRLVLARHLAIKTRNSKQEPPISLRDWSIHSFSQNIFIMHVSCIWLKDLLLTVHKPMHFLQFLVSAFLRGVKVYVSASKLLMKNAPKIAQFLTQSNRARNYLPLKVVIVLIFAYLELSKQLRMLRPAPLKHFKYMLSLRHGWCDVSSEIINYKKFIRDTSNVMNSSFTAGCSLFRIQKIWKLLFGQIISQKKSQQINR